MNESERYLTIEDARDLGVLQEVNRRLLHPRGLAIEGDLEIDGGAVYTLTFYKQGIEQLRRLVELVREHSVQPSEWTRDLERRIEEAAANPMSGIFRIRDEHDDPEGMIFGPEELPGVRREKAETFESLVRPEREQALGFVEQPLD